MTCADTMESVLVRSQKVLCFAPPTFRRSLPGGTQRAQAQFETSITGGTWTAFLPEYEGFTAEGIDQNDVGGRVQVRSQYHFEPTRTIAEVRATLAGADFDGTRFTTDAFGPSMDASFRSRVVYNDLFLGLRDKFDLADWGLGKITLGAGFSHMHFDQTFDSEGTAGTPANAFDITDELQSSYVGGEIVGSMTRRFLGRRVYLDGSIGIYDLDADYRATGPVTLGGGTVPATETDTFSDVAYMFNLTLRTEFQFAGVLFRPTTGVQYISSMPGIDILRPTFLQEDDAFILNGGWEFTF